MAVTLEDLGMTVEQLQERVIDKICDELLTRTTTYADEDGNPCKSERDSRFKDKIKKRIEERIDKKIDEMAETFVLPGVGKLVEEVTFQKTNEWGEKKGHSMTFVEYLVSRCESYMTEKVDYQGKTKAEAGSYSWSAAQTRVAYMIHSHLHFEIEKAMKQALQDANSFIVGGLKAAIQMKLDEVSKSLSVTVKTK